jgi:hypothetical protein
MRERYKFQIIFHENSMSFWIIKYIFKALSTCRPEARNITWEFYIIECGVLGKGKYFFLSYVICIYWQKSLFVGFLNLMPHLWRGNIIFVGRRLLNPLTFLAIQDQTSQTPIMSVLWQGTWREYNSFANFAVLQPTAKWIKQQYKHFGPTELNLLNGNLHYYMFRFVRNHYQVIHTKYLSHILSSCFSLPFIKWCV